MCRAGRTNGFPNIFFKTVYTHTKNKKHNYFYRNARRNSSRNILDVPKQTKNGVEHEI